MTSSATNAAVRRTVLVTGAGGGIARGINARLSAAGFDLVCADLGSAAETAAEAVRAGGGNALAVAVDVTDDASVADLQSVLDASDIRVDAVVNVAGVMNRGGLADLSAADFERVVAINLVGPYRVIRAFAPGMIERGWGRVVNISSIAARNGYPFPSYAASKAGLSNLTRSLLDDFWGTGVTVNNVCPGPVEAPMLSDAVREEIRRHVPTARAVEPDEIGAAVAYLLSDDARSISGADLVVDGGASAYFQLSDRPDAVR